MEEIVEKLKQEIVKTIAGLVRTSLEESSVEIAKKRGIETGTYNIYPEIDNVIKRFTKFLKFDFDKLVTTPTQKRVQLGSSMLTLVNEDYYESANALEGMVAFCRNVNIKEYISFTTRLDSIFFHFHIDESNNPLDPEQIGEAFVDSLRSLPLNANDTLVVYRKFNQVVFHKLGRVLAQANKLLVERDVNPSLVVHTQSRETQLRKRNLNRPVSDPVERAFSDNEQGQTKNNKGGAPQLFALLQKLTHGLAPGEWDTDPQDTKQGGELELAIPVAAMTGQHFGDGLLSDSGLMLVNVQADMVLGGLNVEVLTREQLVEILKGVQNELNGKAKVLSDIDKECLRAKELISQAIKDSASQGAISAIDISCYDIINILTMVYAVIATEVSLVEPIKRLICITQVSIIKLALIDENFFNQAEHPARSLLNNVANAGIGWVDLEKLKNDLTYLKMEELIGRFVAEYNGDTELIKGLVKDFKQFKLKQKEGSNETKVTGGNSSEQNQRVENIDAYVTQKIKERISEELKPIVATILLEHFHKFMTILVMREGVGSNSWKHVINTIDELLWTVKSEKAEGDRERLGKVNPKLLKNLAGAFRIAGVEKAIADPLLSQLKEAQEQSFEAAASREITQAAVETVNGVQVLVNDIPINFGDDDTPDKSLSIPETDEFLLQVNKLPLGVWVEFKFSEDRMIPCTLAAKLDTIDKFIFINRQGVKIVEKSRMGLARELKSGTLKIISEWPLFERAMESVIGALRESMVT